MKKLATLISTLALASTLAIAGCKKKEEATTEAPKTTDTVVAPAADPAAAPTAPAADPAAAPAAAAGDLPAECNDYKAALEKVAACDKIPAAAKDAYKNAWSGIETSLTAATTPETKAAVATSCKAGADGLKTAAAGCF
jgi:hypothetical protein